MENMINAIIGQKLGMTQEFLKNGQVVPLTVVEAGPCFILQVKNKENDGYEAVKIAFGQSKGKYAKKPTLGEMKKAKKTLAPALIVEVSGGGKNLKVGEEIKVDDIFKKGDFVDATGFSKGRGFAGVIKRWGFHGGPATHGQSDRQRAPGSIGQRTTPGRVYKGKKMPGRMGNKKVTVRNLEIIEIDEAKNLLYVKGAIPGARRGMVVIKKRKTQKSRHSSASWRKNDKVR